MLKNLPQVTKNLLLLNVLFFIVAIVVDSNGAGISEKLGAHYFNSLLFEPYQVITYMFMHSLVNPMHIIFNMLLLVMFGGHLERIWGTKRYFIFYMACGFGSLVLYNSIGVWQIEELKSLLIQDGYDITSLNNQIASKNFDSIVLNSEDSQAIVQKYINMSYSSVVGASGAIFGLLAGFGMLFPNTKLMLLFPPIPVKAKYLIGGYLAYEVYNSIYRSGDQVAHLAHVGGAIVGFIFILVWRRKDRQNFY